MNLDCDRFSNSMISDFIDCPAKFYFGWYKNLRSLSLDLHLEFGNSIHLACEHYFRQIEGGQQADKNLEVETLQIFLDDINQKDLEISASKNQQVGVSVLGDFFSQYKYTSPDDVLAVEQRIGRVIKGHTYTGRIDLLLMKNGRVTTVDHKTTGRLMSNTAEKWQLSRQLIGYQWLTKAQDLKVNLFHCIKTNPAMYIYPFMFSPTKLERWEYQTVAILDMIAERVQMMNRFLSHPQHTYLPDAIFPRLGTRCISYSCEFKCLCDQDVPLVEIIVPALEFRERQDKEYW